ncbi:MAG: hypothetical protein HQ481_02795, partial [Alphaproteobacteria bacterium]|nr:hypothetical protein [Alphaproteobacteria bacterium]
MLAATRPLTRRFALWCFPLLAAVAIVLFLTYRHATETTIRATAENVALSIERTLTNTLWSRYSAFLLSAEALDQTPARIHPTTARLDKDIRALIEGTDVLKVKIFSASGKTVFSTDFTQIGKGYARKEDFVAALEGEVESAKSWRDTFQTVDGKRTDVRVLATYLPITSSGDPDTAVAIIEIYLDITTVTEQSYRGEAMIVAAVLTPLILLAVFLTEILHMRSSQPKKCASDRYH